MSGFLALIARDLCLAFRQGAALTLSVSFFFLAVLLFPLGVGPEAAVLSRIAAGVLWVAALLAVLLSLDRLFQADYEDGSLDLLALSPLPLELVALAKCLAHWIGAGLPLVIVAPLLALLLDLPAKGFGALLAALFLGTPSLSFIGGIGAALTVSIRRGGVLLALLVLPLYIPVLIFGVAAVGAAAQGLPAAPDLLILGAIALASLVLCPIAAGAALRLALE